MNELSKTRLHYVELLRNNNFNCFPIPENQKIADRRYNASQTQNNQPISQNENFGYIPVIGKGTAIIDFDHKEKYRLFAEHMIEKGYMVIETGNGWHIPVKELSSLSSKIELFDYKIQNKKIIEIQGPNHYCVGPGSTILHDKLKRQVIYENRGTDKIWDAEGLDFNSFVDQLCLQCKVQPRKKNTSSNFNMRQRFLQMLPPTPGTSNDYFFQAAIQCNTDGIAEESALEKIREVYDIWEQSSSFSNRPWSNIEAKIRDVYENDRKLSVGKPPKDKRGVINRTEIAQRIIEGRKIFSDVNTSEIFENCNGFLEKINNTLLREIMKRFPELEEVDYNSILFKLKGMAKSAPPTNKNLIVFKNDVFDKRTRQLIETDEIADMGFKNYDYLPPTEENIPTKFISATFDNIPKSEHPRVKAGLRSILSNYLDPKISVIHGRSGVGKSTPLLILVEILGEYAMVVELENLLKDGFIRAKVNGLRLLVLQELPQKWKEFSQLKVMTGESKITARGFMKDSVMFENKLKIWASGNYLTEIPENEKNALYSRRLSLIHNLKQEAYQENPNLIEDISREEGEKIISWILNLKDDECKYEDNKTVCQEWEHIASPELEYLEKNYDITGEIVEVSVISLVRDFNEKFDTITDVGKMANALRKLGYVNKFNIIKNIKIRPQQISIVQASILE